MSVLSALTDALASATVEVVDLTAPLSSSTPVIKLPEPFGNTVTFALHEISRFDDRGPGWYWNDITTGEHTGTHFDAPCHWITGRDREDVSQVPAGPMIAPPGILAFPADAPANPAFLPPRTPLENLASPPPSGVVLIVTPLPITGGSGSPCRALALVDRSGS